MKTLLTLLFWVSFFSQAISQELWPTKTWVATTPAQLSLDEDSLIFLDKELASGKYGHVDGMFITRHGKVAYEKSYKNNYGEIYGQEAKEKNGLNAGDASGPYNYFNAWWHPFYQNSQLHTLQSVTKTITSVIIGVAITRKDFPDVNTSILKYFDTSLVENIDDRKRKITIRDLLTMTAGFNWNENLSYADPNNTGSSMEASCDWVNYTINRPMKDEPGKVFNYNSGATQILAYIFRIATGIDIEEYGVKYLFAPLGIKDHYWKRSPSGLVDCEGGLYLDKNDVAKIFYLYLKKGKWEDKQIVSEDWIKQSLSPYIKVGPNLSYGYKWWLSGYGNNNREQVWRGSGFGGQFPMIIPEYDMVVVFTAWNISERKTFYNYNPGFLLNRVLHSVKEYNYKNK